MKKRNSFVSNSSTTSFILVDSRKEKKEPIKVVVKIDDFNKHGIYPTDINTVDEFIIAFFHYQMGLDGFSTNKYLDPPYSEGEKIFREYLRAKGTEKEYELFSKFMDLVLDSNPRIYTFLNDTIIKISKGATVKFIDDVEYHSDAYGILSGKSENESVEFFDTEALY